MPLTKEEAVKIKKLIRECSEMFHGVRVLDSETALSIIDDFTEGSVHVAIESLINEFEIGLAKAKLLQHTDQCPKK